MIAEVEQHDYVPSEDRQSAMLTDPQCEVCGFREDNPVHWQKFPVRNCSEPWPHKGHTICFRDDWTKTWQCTGVPDLSRGEHTADELRAEVYRIEDLISNEVNGDTKRRLGTYRDDLWRVLAPRGRMHVTKMHKNYSSRPDRPTTNPVLVAFRADFKRLSPVSLSIVAEAWYFRMERLAFEETHVYPVTGYPPPFGNGRKVTLDHRYQARQVLSRLVTSE